MHDPASLAMLGAAWRPRFDTMVQSQAVSLSGARTSNIFARPCMYDHTLVHLHVSRNEAM
jgi:hypothetical protein